MRVLVLSHGHPDLGAGGAERAAYSLFQRLKHDSRIENAVFVARAEHEAIGHSAFFGSFRGRPDEILAAPPPVDGFTFQSLNYDLLKQLVEELVAATRPDVVHIHHFIYWGIEIFELFKAAGARVVFTFHEYAAICANYGQMIKTDKRLCYASSPAECSLCIPSMSAGKFFVRQTILQSLLSHVDDFVSPSEFLKKRYVAWGLPATKIAVIENVMDQDVLSESQRQVVLAPVSAGQRRTQAAAMPDRRIVFAFFGQINPYKGVDVLLEAATMLPEPVQDRIEIRLHGENKHYRGGEFGEKLETLLTKTGDVVRPMGAYRNQDVINLMTASDWIVVPSIWWENSPIVIQEARMAGRPLLCSDIGGMAEKVSPGVDLLFTAGSAGALARAITEIVNGATLPEGSSLAELSRSRQQADENAYTTHLAIYQAVATAHMAESAPRRRSRAV